mmetsp:Transcript_55282/g.140486  ORF Transcript_55282/g.140486 Transcript_55282/m.140486 type:complete len:190 (-) Transcript_55282:167-736(-)
MCSMKASSVPLDTSNNPNDMGVTLFKTEMCRLIQTGGCRRKFCRFAHSEAELRPKPDLMKTRPCHFLLDRGYCRNRQCGFAHNAAELRKVPGASSMRGGAQEKAGHLQGAVPISTTKLQLVCRTGGKVPAINAVINPHAQPLPAPQHVQHLPVACGSIVQRHSLEELVALFRAIPPELLTLAQPVRYFD